jgi:hypothetical protein
MPLHIWRPLLPYIAPRRFKSVVIPALRNFINDSRRRGGLISRRHRMTSGQRKRRHQPGQDKQFLHRRAS